MTQQQRGRLSYTPNGGDERSLEFQFNPVSLSRSRSVTAVNTKAPTLGSAQTDDVSPAAGQTFASKADNWRMSLNIRLDSTRLFGTSTRYSYSNQLDSLAQAIAFLEGTVEPVADRREQNKGQFPPERTPNVRFDWGPRSWSAQVTQITINEDWYSTDLRPARVEATLDLVIIETVAEAIDGTGASGTEGVGD